MIYTLGYYAVKIARLVEILDTLEVSKLIDVRSIPKSRNPEYNKSRLAAFLGGRYEWRGDTLGGLGNGPTREGLKDLSAIAEGGAVAIMCMERSPGDCHRHHTIGLPLARAGKDVLHVFDDHLIDPLDLQHAIDTGSEEYPCRTWR